MDKAQALHSAMSSFNLKAYDENSVPTEANLPYLTYRAVFDDMFNTAFVSASIWYRSTSWAEISQKCDEIAEWLGTGGQLIPFENGVLWIRRGSPFSQRMNDTDDSIRRIYMNLEADFLSVI